MTYDFFDGTKVRRAKQANNTTFMVFFGKVAQINHCQVNAP
jgi:hypothetical protein